MTKKVTALVCGAGGFIGGHLVDRLKAEGRFVVGLDMKQSEFHTNAADDFIICDLRDQSMTAQSFRHKFDEVYHLAADMGGAGYVFTGENDAKIMYNSTQMTLNVLDRCQEMGISQLFYSSSACIYPQENQLDADTPNCAEATAYPANPDSDYGWEKLYGERLFQAFSRNFQMTAKIGRYHNIYGRRGVWQGGLEKSPAALCRKIAMAPDGGSIDIWGDGQQTRSFLHIEDCLSATLRLMRSEFFGPVNIGSEEMISIDQLARLIIGFSGKNLDIQHVPGPLGVRGRNSNNNIIRDKLAWEPSVSLQVGMSDLYNWVQSEVLKANGDY